MLLRRRCPALFSRRPDQTGVNAITTADLWQVLMNDVLGYERFGAHGGDWGAMITAQLGHKYAGRMIGVHMQNGAPLDFFTAGLPAASDYAPDEAGWYEKTTDFFAHKAVHVAVQSAEPQTMSYGFTDSPVGLCAWLVEKRRNWSDCGGDVRAALQQGRTAHFGDALLVDGKLWHFGALLRRGQAPSVATQPSRRPGSQRAHGYRVIRRRPVPLAAALA